LRLVGENTLRLCARAEPTTFIWRFYQSLQALEDTMLESSDQLEAAFNRLDLRKSGPLQRFFVFAFCFVD
jgi:hypothetical protein